MVSDTAAGNRRVIVFGLGGTIAMTTDEAGGVVPALSADQLVAAVPGLTDTGISVEVNDFRRMPSASLTFDDLTELAEAVRVGLTTGDADGAVITQGTDTIEETAYFLDLIYPLPHPLVITGAMRNPTLAGADGPANLLAAVHVAAHPQVRGQGAMVVMADEIHAARRVRKTHSTSCMTFQSPNGGPLGYVVEGQVRLVNRVDRRAAVPLKRNGTTRVALLTTVLDDDGSVLNALAGRVDGLVVAATGVGHVPERLVPLLDELADRIPVVLASRTGAGPVLQATYAFPGSERDLLSRGLISAGFLDPLKARILLHSLLSSQADRAAISAAFGAAGGYADPEIWPWREKT